MIPLISDPLGALAVGFFIEAVPLATFFIGVTAVSGAAAITCGHMLKKHFKNVKVLMRNE